MNKFRKISLKIEIYVDRRDKKLFNKFQKSILIVFLHLYEKLCVQDSRTNGC